MSILKIIFLNLVVFLSLLNSSCYQFNKKNMVDLLDNNISCTLNKKICIETDLVKLKKKGALPYQVFCINGEKVASGYPTINKFGIYINTSFSKNTSINNYKLIIKKKDKIIIYDMNKSNFNILNIDKTFLNMSPLDKNLILIEKYFFKTKSLGVIILDTQNWSAKVIDTPFDDIYRNIDYKNNFVLDQIKKKIRDFKKDSNSDSFINTINYIKLPYKKQGSYILDKNLNIISYKETNQTKTINTKFQDLKNKLVHSNKSIFILIASLLSILIVIKLLYYISDNSFQLPIITTFFMLAYLIFVYIGAVSLNIFHFEYEFNTHLYERKDLLYKIWLYTTYGLYLIPLGAFLIKKVLYMYRPIKIKTFFNKPINYNFNDEKLFFIILFLFIVSILILFLYVKQINYNVPIFGVFQHLTPEELAKLRSDSGNNFNGHLYRYVLFFKDIPLFLLLIAFTLKSKNSKWNILFYTLIVYNIFVNIMDISKAPLINIFLMLLLMFFYIRRRIYWKILIIVGIIGISLLIIMYIFFMGGSKEGLLSTALAPFHRAFIGSISPLFWWQLYIEQHGYLQGMTLPNPHHIFDFNHIDISKKVMSFAHTELKDMGIVGSMPVVFFVEWYANYSWFYAVVSMIIFGMILFVIDYIFINKMLIDKRGVLLATYIYIMYYFKRYSVTSISGILIDVHLIIPVALGVFLYIVTRKNS